MVNKIENRLTLNWLNKFILCFKKQH